MKFVNEVRVLSANSKINDGSTFVVTYTGNYRFSILRVQFQNLQKLFGQFQSRLQNFGDGPRANG